MSNMYERAFVVSADYAEDEADLEPTERGDDVIVVATQTHDYHLHLRRGMDANDVADGLESFAETLRSNA